MEVDLFLEEKLMEIRRTLDDSEYDPNSEARLDKHMAMLEACFKQICIGRRFFEMDGRSNAIIASYPLNFLQVIGGLVFVRDVFRAAGTIPVEPHLTKSRGYIDLLLKHFPTSLAGFCAAPKTSRGLSRTGIWCIQVAVSLRNVQDRAENVSDEVIEAIAHKAVSQAMSYAGEVE